MARSRIVSAVVALAGIAGIAVLLVLRGCGSSLPERRPADFAFSFGSSTGGMTPHPFCSSFSHGPGGTSYNENGRSVSLAPTPQQLDAFYRAFHDHHFDLVRTTSRPTMYDAGGFDMTLTAEGKTYHVEESANTTIGSGREDYEAIDQELSTLVAPLIDAARIEVPVRFDPALVGKAATLSLDRDEPAFTTRALEKPEATIRVFPGTYTVILHAGDEHGGASLDLQAGKAIRVTRSGGILALDAVPR